MELASRTPDGGMVRLWSVGTAFDLQGDQALAPYVELAAQLGRLPGRKAVALFRPDVNLDRQGLDVRSVERVRQSRDNLDADVARSQQALDRLETVAVFARTAFYPSNTALEGSINAPGLNRIATSTGGRPLLGTGDPGAIFNLILEDAKDYYVVSYDPALEGNGARRSIRADVEGKGLKVQAPRGYLDLEGLDDLGRPASSPLDLDPEAADLPIRLSHAFFRGADGKPLAIFAAGVDAAELDPAQDGKSVTVELTAAAGARDGSGGWAVREQQASRQVFAGKAFQSAIKKGGAPIEVTLTAALPASGSQTLEVALRDEGSGRYGLDATALWAPDFTRPLATSTLVVTRRAIETKKAKQTPSWGDALDYDTTRLIPESTREFTVGDTLLFSYRLYNTPPEMLQQSPAPQIALLLNEVQVEEFDLQAESRVDRDTVQYMGALRTDNLEPGDYILLSAVPGRNDERQPYVEAQFRLVGK